MHPIIVKLGPFTIYSYGLMLALAFITSSMLAVSGGKRKGISPDIIFNLVFIGFISGIIGARFFYVIENISYYLKYPLEIVMLQQGGLSWFGGLIAGVLSGLIYLKRKKAAVYKVLDLISPYVALAQGIGRVGCLLNGCCFGRAFIPIQVYSSLSLLLIFIILRCLQERPHREGEIFFSYLILYCTKRFFIEFWRLDNPVIFLRLTLFQIISIVILILSLTKLLLLKKSK